MNRQLRRQYEAPVIEWEDRDIDIQTTWLCLVTLLVLFRYLKLIILYVPEK